MLLSSVEDCAFPAGFLFFFFLVGLGVTQKERDGVAETIGGVLQNPVSFFHALAHKGLPSSVSIEVISGSWTAFWGQWDI